jgi:hypothetical protein
MALPANPPNRFRVAVAQNINTVWCLLPKSGGIELNSEDMNSRGV